MKFQLSEWIEALQKADCPQAICKGYGRPDGSRCAIGVAFDVMVEKFPLRYGWEWYDEGPLGFRPVDLVKKKSLVAGEIVSEFLKNKPSSAVPFIPYVTKLIIHKNDIEEDDFKQIALYLREVQP